MPHNWRPGWYDGAGKLERMGEYPQLVYLSVQELIGAAGGDPWHVDETIQAGSPGEISELATSFRSAGVCLTQTDEEYPRRRPLIRDFSA